MIDSVRTRLTLWYVAILALALIVFALLVYSVTARNFYEHQDESLRSTAETLASIYLEELEEEKSAAKANEVVLAQMVFPNRYVEVTDADGRVIAESSNFDAHSFPISPVTRDEAQQRGISFFSQNGLRVAVAPISRETNNRLGFAVVAESLNVIETSLTGLRRSFYAGVPLILVLASLGGYFLARKSLAPVALMDQQTRSISAGSLSARLNVPNSRDEVGRLAITINDLLARLDAAFQEQQRFVADSSHELRTPVTVVRAEAEVALEQERNPAEYQNSLALIKDEAERLSRIVEDLFLLARQPFGSPALVRETVSLDELVRECGRAAQVLATRKGLKLEIPAELPELRVKGDDELLKRMVLNLLDNAVKYTPADGEVQISLAARNGNAQISITDTGMGIPPEDQARVFDRFYRVDKARSRALGGAGLGLSIARWIVEAHGGELSMESTLGKGTSFVAGLPLQN